MLVIAVISLETRGRMLALSREWKTKELRKAMMDHDSGPAPYANVTCITRWSMLAISDALSVAVNTQARCQSRTGALVPKARCMSKGIHFLGFN